MPTTSEKPPARRDFLKRRTFEQGRALADAAHIATHRLYCDTLGFWRRCPKAPCKRHRRWKGEPIGCLLRGLPDLPPERRREAEIEVIAGGPRRVPPASHMEWVLRRTTLAKVAAWPLGKAAVD